jgi:hypothetical protein
MCGILNVVRELYRGVVMKRTKVLLVIILIILVGVIFYLIFKDYEMQSKISNLEALNQENLNMLNSYKESTDAYSEDLENHDYELLKSREGTYSVDTLKSLDLTGYDKIMITTHPDDEMFWGGGHLIEDNYLVVCVTCGMDDNRQKEFEKTMSDTNNKYIMLTYPRVVDKSLNREFNWNATAYLTEDLQNILSLKNWDMIVTHNPDGEYGHKYHKLTSQVVTALVKDKSKLYYFGKYYTKDKVDKLSTDTLSDELYNKKDAIIVANYKSQAGSRLNHIHMFKNENFIKYENWK